MGSKNEMETLKEKFRFDRTAFQQCSAKEADEQMTESKHLSPKERLQYSLYLTARAYGFDPDQRPPMDKSHFEIIHRDG